MPLDLTQPPRTDATRLYAVRDSLFATDMLIAAVKGLDFFTWMAAGPKTIDDITAHYGFASRPVDVMTTLFVAMRLLEREGQALRLTDAAREHLVGTSRFFIGPYYPPVTDRPIARDLIEVLRTGQPARYAGRAEQDDWHQAMTTEAFAREFTAAMDARGVITAQALAERLPLPRGARLLDVAGGSGVFACAFAASQPGISAAVFEKPPVDAVATEAIARRGLASSVTVVAGDMFGDPLPPGYDVHLFSNVLHDWDEPEVLALMAKSAAALPSGGTIVIHETFLDADKAGPLAVAEYSVLLMHVTQGRCYGVTEMDRWLRAAGFRDIRTVEGALGRSAIAATRA